MADNYNLNIDGDSKRGNTISSIKNNTSNSNHLGKVQFDSPVDHQFRNGLNFLFNANIPSDDILYNVSSGIERNWDKGYIAMKGHASNMKLKCRIPILGSFQYKITITGDKLHSGAAAYGRFYCGVQSLDDNFNAISKDNATSFNYGVADSVYPSYSPNPDKKDHSYNPFRYSGFFSHFNNPETSAKPGHGSTANSRHHNRFDPGAKYFDIYVLANYWSGGSGDNYTTSADKLETRIYGITVSANP